MYNPFSSKQKICLFKQNDIFVKVDNISIMLGQGHYFMGTHVLNSYIIGLFYKSKQ